MLRAGQKRRRTTSEIQEEKKVALSRQAAIEAKLATMDLLKANNDQLRAEADNHRNSTNILNDLASKKKIRVND